MCLAVYAMDKCWKILTILFFNDGIDVEGERGFIRRLNSQRGADYNYYYYTIIIFI